MIDISMASIARRRLRVKKCLRRHVISRVPGADVPGAFASKLGRGEVKAWPRGESHSPPVTKPLLESWRSRVLRLFDDLVGLDREQQKICESVRGDGVGIAKIAIGIGILRQPDSRVLRPKLNRGVVNRQIH